MKDTLVAGALALAALAGSTALASASVITVFANEYDHAGGTLLASQTQALVAPIGSFGLIVGDFKLISGYGTDNTGQQLVSSIQVQGKTAAQGKYLTVEILETGLTPITPNFTTSYSNNAAPKGWTITEETFAGATSIFAPISGASTGVTNGVHSGAFTGGGSSTVPVSSPYSLEEFYTYTLSTTASVAKATNSGVTLTYTAVPEASTWAMMLAGFAGLGLFGFSRSQKGRVYEA
jgi:hypothetical protein